MSTNRAEPDPDPLTFERKQYCKHCRDAIHFDDPSRCDACLYMVRICGHDCYWLIADMEGKT